MIAVTDSSPLVVLVGIGCVHALPALFDRIVIPPEVAIEVAAPKRPEAVRAFMAAPPAWLEIRPAATVEAVAGLHSGETAAIALARELAPGNLVIDERQGRRAAVERGIRVIGTVGVLELAAARKLVDLASAFEAIKRTDFWISPEFLDERLSLFRERTRGLG